MGVDVGGHLDRGVAEKLLSGAQVDAGMVQGGGCELSGRMRNEG